MAIPIYKVLPYFVISISHGRLRAIAPAVHSPHLVTVSERAWTCTKPRSPDSDSIPVILARAGQKKIEGVLRRG